MPSGGARPTSALVGLAPPEGMEQSCQGPDGTKHGQWTRWHGNGERALERSFQAGVPHGPVRLWYDNGQPSEAGNYDQGKPVGTWTFWYRNGVKWFEFNYNEVGLLHCS